MDNLEEAKGMLNVKHQMNCAVAIAKGICDYFGVAYVPPKAKEEGLQTRKIKINITYKKGILLVIVEDAYSI
ncbi:MAG: hypothetical protein GX238_12015 [Epulopiscium sp.]|nr:hypothetical protein [Candidatus Epulonipiscium sp.]